jgi:CheY-like chemotaxis protein
MQEAPAAGTRILMVDDDDDVRSIAATFLRDAGYVVAEASGAAQALEIVRSAPVDLVVTDLAMPGMDGVQLAALIRAELPRVKVMFVTGYAADYELGGELMLQKPYGARTLLQAVAGVVRG